MNPTIGRVLHYCLPGSSPNEPKIRPAIVTEAWLGFSHVNLEVFLSHDDVKDLIPVEVRQRKHPTSVSHSVGYPPRPGEWQWPPRAEIPNATGGSTPSVGGEVPSPALSGSGEAPPADGPPPTAPVAVPSVKPAPKRR